MPNFIANDDEEIKKLQEMYPVGTIVERYQNFLEWLQQTFRVTSIELRNQIYGQLSIPVGAKVLFTGVGTGEDVIYFVEVLNRRDLRIHFQDASKEMVLYSAVTLKERGIKYEECNVSNASQLPYLDNTFDYVLHFGGINWFGDKKSAIQEMVRVSKEEGKVVFGDEGVAPWLRNTEYGRMMINNNTLWKAEPPLDLMPFNINDFKLKYILENCFYVIECTKNSLFPNVDFEVKHKSPRGGSIRTRWDELQ